MRPPPASFASPGRTPTSLTEPSSAAGHGDAEDGHRRGVLTARTGRHLDPATRRVTWEYEGKPGETILDHPSLARELPGNGDILVADDWRERVVVIDRRTKQIIWQYGVTDRKGHAPGYLTYPDRFDIDVFRDWRAARAGRASWAGSRAVASPGAAALSEETMLRRERHGLQSTVHAQLREDVLDVVTDRRTAHVQPLGGDGRAEAVGHESQHL